MSNFDNQLARMKGLMNYGKVNEEASPRNNYTLEFHKVAADGRTYGIIRECNKYYIKLAETGKELVAENYNYIGGFNNKKDYEYFSYANALKHFELKLASINEACEGKVNITTLDPFRGNSVLVEATDKMKDEIARQRQIMYNAAMLMNEEAIGATPIKNQPEAEHENSGDEDAPFVKAVTPDMEFDGAKESCPKCAGDPFDKGEKCSCKAEEGKDVVVKDSVASMKPKGGKVVRVNEEFVSFDPENDDEFDDIDKRGKKIKSGNEEEDDYQELGPDDMPVEDDYSEDYIDGLDDDLRNLRIYSPGEKMGDEDDDLDLYESEDRFNEGLPGEAGVGDAREFEEWVEGSKTVNEEEELDLDDDDDDDDVDLGFESDEDSEEGDDLGDEESDMDFDGEEEEVDETDPESVRSEIERLQAVLDDLEGDEDIDAEGDDDFDGDDFEGEFSGEFEGEEPEGEDDGDDVEEVEECGINEAKRAYMNSIVESVVKMIKEDELHDFGKHPGYRKKPMQLPATGEDKNQHGEDWNDESVHSEAPFGSQIGSSAPFEDVVSKIAAKLMEDLKKK